jgi:hypothetical protein
MAQNLAQLTDQWMVNPTMFDPTQASNQFSNYNAAALPWPPTYNTGLQGGPVNAATGKPIQSFQQWQQANPGGMSINSTPAAPGAAPQQQFGGSPWSPGGYGLGMNGANPQIARPGTPGSGGVPYFPQASPPWPGQMQQQAPQAAPQAQAGGAPNNWQAAINALANPGNPTTMGANVPLVTGSQPAGGVNQAFLQQAGAGQGMNQNFLSALRAIQARPQQ